MKEDLICSYIDNYVDNNSGYNELTPLIRKIEQEQSIKIQNDKIRAFHKEEERKRIEEENNRKKEENNRKKEEERIAQQNEAKRKTERKKRIGKMLKESKIKKIEGKTRVLNNFLNDQPIDHNDECYKKIMESKLRRFLNTETGKQRIYDYKQNKEKEIDVSYLGLCYHREWKHHRLAESADIDIYKFYKKKYHISIKGINSIENSPRLVLLAPALKIVLNAWLLGILAFVGLCLAITNTFWITCSSGENWDIKTFWFLGIAFSFCAFCCCTIPCMVRETSYDDNNYFYDPEKSNIIYDPTIKILKSRNIKKIVVMRVIYLFFALLLITSTIVLSFVQTVGWCWIMRIANLIIGIIIVFGSTIFALNANRESKKYYGIWRLFVLKSSNEDKYYKNVGLLINDDTDINEI